ncbi:GNAT family N-acetyltransferase [Palleronia sediminis]|uniref:GNAT family N-acetyltransferase n=1 Tax=Palleronia sediminis TaxID=2547833 RepID=A0A4R5ZXG7_9RHOB|nr:GNAT family N-acetyltransferase [Palleronia sediminis]TDL74118.1 GNAT family N-acetyltransferase [Palleronia sediminis]
MSIYRFRRPNIEDLDLLNGWLQKPHMSEWWDVESVYTADKLDQPHVVIRVVEARGFPFALMQDYDVHAQEGHHFAHLPPGSRGLDQFIGEPAMLGLSHGPAFIAQRMAELFADGAPVLAVDPHPDNTRAIAAYRKVGFGVTGDPLMTEWGMILPMEAAR